MCMKTSIDDYGNLCRLDVLVPIDIVRDDSTVHQDFKDKMMKSKDGWYETSLMWKNRFTSLQNNKLGSLGKLNNLLRNFRGNQKLSHSCFEGHNPPLLFLHPFLVKPTFFEIFSTLLLKINNSSSENILVTSSFQTIFL